MIATKSLSPVAYNAIMAMKRGEVYVCDFTIEWADGTTYTTPKQTAAAAYPFSLEDDTSESSTDTPRFTPIETPGETPSFKDHKMLDQDAIHKLAVKYKDDVMAGVLISTEIDTNQDLFELFINKIDTFYNQAMSKRDKKKSKTPAQLAGSLKES